MVVLINLNYLVLAVIINYNRYRWSRCVAWFRDQSPRINKTYSTLKIRDLEENVCINQSKHLCKILQKQFWEATSMLAWNRRSEIGDRANRRGNCHAHQLHNLYYRYHLSPADWHPFYWNVFFFIKIWCKYSIIHARLFKPRSLPH